MKIIICCTSNPRSKKFLKKLDLISRQGSWGRGSSRASPGITQQASDWPGNKIQVCCLISTCSPLTNTIVPIPSLYSYTWFLTVLGKCYFCARFQSKLSYLNLLNFKMLYYFAFTDEKMLIPPVSSYHRNDTLINLSARDVCCQKIGSFKRWKMWFKMAKTFGYLHDKHNRGRFSSWVLWWGFLNVSC